MIRISNPDDLGPVLADLRKLTQMRRYELAELAGIAQQQYGQYELGQRVPSVGTLLRIFGALGYDLALVPRDDA